MNITNKYEKIKNKTHLLKRLPANNNTGEDADYTP